MQNDGHLISWIGYHDLNGIENPNNHGPLNQCICDINPTKVTLLCDYSKVQGQAYFDWIKDFTKAEIQLRHLNLSNPTDYESIYLSVRPLLEEFKSDAKPLLYNVTSGTPAMTSIWILLAKTTYPGNLYHTHQETGTSKINFPFELTADYLPAFKTTSVGLTDLSEGLDSESVAFEEIIHEDIQMKKVVARARRLAQHDVPVLIQGETGTGKELFAKAIHDESPRKQKNFFAVNCGALPTELVESQFFGYTKGAFTGANEDTAGIFENTEGGTVFLDEIGELPLVSQVKLLRALQEGEITRVGDSETIKIDVRIIAATHKNLIEMSSTGEFRSDLFYRIAVGTLLLPPLRERKNDLVLIAKEIIRKINNTNQDLTAWQDKTLTSSALKAIKEHSWPGNVRELVNTLHRTSIWANGEELTGEHIKESLLSISTKADTINFGELHQGFCLRDKIDEVYRYYLNEAFDIANGKLKDASALLGEKNYQNVTNWRKKYLNNLK